MDHLAYKMERTDNPANFNNYKNVSPLNKTCKVTLKNSELWKKFHNLETEMIITKSGRRMFPSLQVQVSEIDPQAMYCIFLEMVPASRCRYKYSSAGGWAPAGSEEAQSPHRIYLHPESPAKGEYWMSQPINFGRLKLTNMPAPPAGQIVLSSMHKYQPRIVVAQTSDPRTMAWSSNTYVAFPETQFIAVTAYQNEKITQLKIDNNPFAKGFRQNGQAKCKRKRACSEEKEEDEELICVTDDNDSLEEKDSLLNNSISAASVGSTESLTTQRLSPRSRLSSEGDKISECSSSVSTQVSPTVKRVKLDHLSAHGIHDTPQADQKGFTESFQNNHYPFPTNSQPYLTPGSYYSYFPVPFLPTSYAPAYYYPYGGYYRSNVEDIVSPRFYYPQKMMKEIKATQPKKLTDFSIKALLGC